MRNQPVRSWVYAAVVMSAGLGMFNVARAGLTVTANGSSELDNDGLGPQTAQVTLQLNSASVQSQRSANIPPSPANPSFPGWSGSTTLFGGGFASFGTLSGSMSASATSTPSVYGVAKTIGNIELTFTDLAAVFSTTGQPVGTPVTLNIHNELAALATFITTSNASKFDNLAYVEFQSDVFDEVTSQHAGFTARNSTFTGSTSTPETILLDAFVGDTLDLFGRLTFHIEAKVGGLQDGPTDASLSVDAAHTAHLFLDAPTGFSVVAGSGHDYSVAAVPEPATLGLLLSGGGLLLVRRRRG